MQEPSPGSTQNVAVVNQNIPVYQDANHPMIGQCSDVPEVAIGAGQGMVQAAAAAAAAAASSAAPSMMDPQAQAQFEADKRAVYKHPLFPLLALLFEKCELATQSAEVPSSESFNMDIQAFVQHQERDRKPFFSEDSEVDGLMVKAIQVLRIHLLELEKVQELCKDFCSRYIACLKNKMQSENLLRPDYPGLNNNITNSGSSTPSNGSNSQSQSIQKDFSSPVEEAVDKARQLVADTNSSYGLQVVTSNGAMNNLVLQSGVSQNAVSMAALNQGQIVSGGTVYQMVQTPQGIVAQPIQIQSTHVQPSVTTAHVIHGSTPLSQIGANASAVPQEARVQPIAPRTPMTNSGDEDDELLSKKKQKRGVLPKHATSIMRSWLFQHIVHPYPTEDEKRQIAAQTNLTLLQVNNWFINARRRILQPMLDASNPDTNHKAKKSKTQSTRPVQRFWPENIASIQPQIPNQHHGQPDLSPNANQDQLQGQVDSQAGTSGIRNNNQCNHYGASSSPGTGQSSPNGSLSQNCSDAGDDKVPSVGSVEDPSMSSSSTEDVKGVK